MADIYRCELYMCHLRENHGKDFKTYKDNSSITLETEEDIGNLGIIVCIDTTDHLHLSIKKPEIVFGSNSLKFCVVYSKINKTLIIMYVKIVKDISRFRIYSLNPSQDETWMITLTMTENALPRSSTMSGVIPCWPSKRERMSFGEYKMKPGVCIDVNIQRTKKITNVTNYLKTVEVYQNIKESVDNLTRFKNEFTFVV